MRTDRRDLASNRNLTAVSAVPRWNAVAPPKLARDAPVPDVLHPLKEDDFPVIRHKANSAASHCFHGLLSQRLRFDEPLIGHERLDDGLAPITFAEIDLVRLHLFEEPLFLESGKNTFARFKPVEPGILARRRSHPSIFPNHFHQRKAVPFPCLKVIRVMRGSDLNDAGTEC